MLLQSWDGALRLLPVWPIGEAASFVDLLTAGAFLVTARTDGGIHGVGGLRIESGAGTACQLMSPWLGKAIAVQRRSDGGNHFLSS